MQSGMGLRETFIDFSVNPPGWSRLGWGRKGGMNGLERQDLAGKLSLPSQK